MIYDCFLFNDELDLLRLRLEFLDKSVDRFVIVESTRTLSGEKKPLYFELNKEKFAGFLPRIIHLVAPANDLPAWEYEFFQRNYIKEGLKQCGDDDIIIISDADEIVNVKEILARPGLQLPAIAELTVYYYFFNMRSEKTFRVNLLAHWSFIRGRDIGNRNINFPTYTNNIITANPGWHFSYLFGHDIEKYKKKIRSFSHAEYNTPYYLDDERIRRCVKLGVDLFERPYIRFHNNRESIESILPCLKKLSLDHLVFTPKWSDRLSLSNWWFIFQKVYFRKLKGLFSKKQAGQTLQ